MPYRFKLVTAGVMYKYDGLLIHESHDDEGIIEVIDYKGIRSLHFGSPSKQSSLILNNPDQLALDYVRAMTSWLLFKPTFDDQALFVGLGGGSLVKHCLLHFPDSTLKVIELRKSVIKIARSHFGLPLDPRLKTLTDDGGAYIRQRRESHREQYSLLFIDAYDHDGIASSIRNIAFFDDCKALLKKNGVLMVNLWGGLQNPEFQLVSSWLGQVFNWQTLFLPVLDKSNIIVLAFNDYTPLYHLKDLRAHALALEQHYHIEYPVFLKDLRKYNASTFDHVIKK